MQQWICLQPRICSRVDHVKVSHTLTMAKPDIKANFRKTIKAKLSELTEDEIRLQSQRAQDLILNLPQYRNANRLSIYLAMPKRELQTSTLVEDALSKNKKVFVPYIHQPPGAKRRVIDMLQLASTDDYKSLKPDGWGIPTLSKDSVNQRENAMGDLGPGSGEMLEPTEDGEGRKGEDGTLDLIVVPGVGFDEGMNRLGHGGGFYDAYLSRFCSDGTRKPFLGRPSIDHASNHSQLFRMISDIANAVGLCLAEQMLSPGQEIPTTHDDWIVDAIAVGDGRLLTLDD
jgi:5-formyltetrahydrofolate cyclo-ligase